MAGALPSPRPPPAGPRPIGRLRTELRSWPTLLLVAFGLLVGIPITVLLTPPQELTVVGQHLSVGARAPSLSLSGPAQLVQIGNTELDIPRLEVYGPLRPKLMMGPVQRNGDAAAVLDPATTEQAQADAAGALTDAFLRWYAWGGIGLLGFTLAATAGAGCVRLLAILRRQSRDEHRHVAVAEVWHQCARKIRAMTIITVAASLLTWVGAGALAYAGSAHGLAGVGSLSDLVGSYHTSPAPVGPKVRGYSGAVIGDSRASRVGGPPVAEATEDDRACERSSDSLAGELGGLLGTRVLNLACPGASIAAGLRGPQPVAGRELPAQIGLLKQVENLEFVAVMIGPNDVNWTDFLRYCYAASDCSDNLTEGEFRYRLAAFDRDYGDLLQDLNELPDRPQIIIVTSYGLFTPSAGCADARGPAAANGLNSTKIELLNNRNDALNAILTAGAEKYRFAVATPRLTPLCEPTPDQLGPDLQGLAASHPFHPTAIGMLRIASAVLRLIATGGT